MSNILDKKQADKVIEILFDFYEDGGTVLNYNNPYELLIATILSAQCTDVRVNMITKDLFKFYPDPQSLSRADILHIQDLIRTCGFFRNKSKNIKNTARMLVENFGGKVPDTREELMTLPGVGRKTANVVISNAFNKPAIAVDTHVFRVSNRIGLANSDDLLETEKELENIIDKKNWSRAHHTLIFHGRKFCKARNPLCKDCPIREYCLFLKESKNG